MGAGRGGGGRAVSSLLHTFTLIPNITLVEAEGKPREKRPHLHCIKEEVTLSASVSPLVKCNELLGEGSKGHLILMTRKMVVACRVLGPKRNQDL